MSWRIFVGEIRQKKRSFRVPSSYVFTPDREEVINSRFRLRYSTTCDTYYRDWSDSISLTSNNVMPGWERGIFALDSVYRNVDEESGEVYFDRIKDSTTGNLKWKFDFSGCGLLVDEITLCLNYLEEYGGEITTTIVGDAGKKRVRYLKGGEYMKFDQLHNSSVITVVVHFIGDPRQVTKLFPQKIMGGIGYPMDILISLKPPLESLGKPRVLLGLMYSNAQEIQVDARHYKEAGRQEPGRGFLHVDFYEAKDLPQQKGRTLETNAKCYLLPNCKKTKCKSSSKKGKNPFWNEQFLIVGVSFLEIKRQALEICFLNNQKKKNKFLGGLRLSLGFSKIKAAQAEKASKVITQLFARPLRKDGDENSSRNNKTNDTEFTTLARFAIAVEKKEKRALHRARVNGSDPSKDTEVEVPPATPSINPDVDIKKTWNLTSTEELNRLDVLNTTHTSSNPSSSVKETEIRENDVAGNSNSPKSTCGENSKSSLSTVLNGIGQHSGDIAGFKETFKETSIDGELWKKQNDQTSSSEGTDKTKRQSNQELSREVQKNGGEMGKGKCKGNELDVNGNKAKTSSQKTVHQNNGNLAQSKVSENQSEPSETEGIRDIKNENEKDGNATTSSSSDSKASEHEEITMTCSASFSHRCGSASSYRQPKKDQKREAKRTQIEKALGDNLESVMLDAVGLEIKQWENMVNKPKHWHYCWHILRKDMIPIHHCNT